MDRLRVAGRAAVPARLRASSSSARCAAAGNDAPRRAARRRLALPSTTVRRAPPPRLTWRRGRGRYVVRGGRRRPRRRHRRRRRGGGRPTAPRQPRRLSASARFWRAASAMTSARARARARRRRRRVSVSPADAVPFEPAPAAPRRPRRQRGPGPVPGRPPPAATRAHRTAQPRVSRRYRPGGRRRGARAAVEDTVAHTARGARRARATSSPLCRATYRRARRHRRERARERRSPATSRAARRFVPAPARIHLRRWVATTASIEGRATEAAAPTRRSARALEDVAQPRRGPAAPEGRRCPPFPCQRPDPVRAAVWVRASPGRATGAVVKPKTSSVTRAPRQFPFRRHPPCPFR